jgi:hypothetical protein
MTKPWRYVVIMGFFLIAVGGLAYYLREPLLRVFHNNPDLDAVILAVLAIGIIFVFRQVFLLAPEVSWLNRYQHREENTPPPPTHSINLLAPMAAMLGERQDQLRLSPTATRALLDGIATRLDERREIARYMIGLLIFLGLLGTFWGLLQTIGSVADAISNLQVAAGDAVQMFSKLKAGIEGPLKGMSTAFGASLFGLSASLVLGFLELQASQAQGRFHTELEEWLARATSLSTAGAAAETPQRIPAYVEALLERNTEGLDGLIRGLQRIEDSRHQTLAGNATLVERLAALAETVRAQQVLLARFTELSIELRAAVSRLSDRSAASEADREAMLAHQRNIEGHLARLVEEGVRNRASLAEELRGAVGQIATRTQAERDAALAEQRDIAQQVARIAEASEASRVRLDKHADDTRRSAEADREAAKGQQSETAALIQRLAEDSERRRAEIVQELRNMVSRVSDRTLGEADREILETHRRTLEAQLLKISEETSRTKGQISEQLETLEKRLTDRALADADREALATHQRTIEATLNRLVEDNARNRSDLADQVRGALGKLTERFSDSDRDAMAAHQRNIEAHLARLVEESASNRSALADELRGELRLLARTIALSRGPAASQAGEPPTADG